MTAISMRQSLALLSVALMPSFGAGFPGILPGVSVSVFHFSLLVALASGMLAITESRRLWSPLPVTHLLILAALSMLSLIVWGAVGGLKLSIAVSHAATLIFAGGLYLGAGDISPKRMAQALAAGLIPMVALDIGAFIFNSPVTSHSDWLRAGYGGIGLNASFQNHGAGLLLGLAGVYIAAGYGAWKDIPARLIAETAIFATAIFSQSRSTMLAVGVTILAYHSLRLLGQYAPKLLKPRPLMGLAIASIGAVIAALAALRVFRPDTADSRLHHFFAALDLLIANPFGGSGATWTATNDKEPHNIIAQYAIQLGLPGVLLLGATTFLFVSALRLGAKERLPGFADAIPACALGIAVEAMLGPDIPFRGISFMVVLVVLLIGGYPELSSSLHQRAKLVAVGARKEEFDKDIVIEGK